MKKILPVAFASLVGLFSLVQYFVPHPSLAGIFRELNRWGVFIFAGALVMGTISLVRHHLQKVASKDKNWPYSLVTLVSLFATAGIGLVTGMERGTLFNDIFVNVLMPTEATMFSLLAFFIASASFRAFRARNLEATVLLLTAVIVMLGRVPIGRLLWSGMPGVANWLLDYANTAAKRAIMIGVGLGIAATAIKVLFGKERSYMGDDG
ncbi:MAG: hypothetical protein GXP49_08220 [Deltaproteobacteria bacterium]|nr:hypothetical protein [Deltaproteobacteria bacterium]